MEQIEREIKLLNVDVKKVKEALEKNGVKPKGKYIQDVYTFDLPPVDVLYTNYINELINHNDNRKIIKLISEIKPCLGKEDIKEIKEALGNEDLIDYINHDSDYKKLLDKRIIKIMKSVNENFSKWVRLRKTGDETTITIKRIVDSKGEYELDAVRELEFEIPSIEDGKNFLEDLGFFFDRHQIKMRIAYDYKDTEIVIDKWPMLAPYVEVEGPTKESIDDAVKMLGFKIDDAIVINTDDVYANEGIDIYADEYRDLSFNDKEQKEVESYLE